MGNYCCRAAASSTNWGGEDWDFLKSCNDSNNKNKKKRASKKVFDEGERGWQKHTNNGTRTLMIRISKRELKELLGGEILADKQQHDGRPVASAEQVLVRLLKANRARENNAHHTPWKPLLDTIPE